MALACSSAGAAESAQEDWAVHGQWTTVVQRHDRFTSPYMGANSLDADGRTEETTDLTLYAGWRLAPHTEAWINAEVDQGFGLSGTLGLAGFSSGEAYKVGANTPYLRLPRAFVRHVIPLGDATDRVEPDLNQLGGETPRDNLTLTIGRLSVVDIFDTNRYAHDPRGDFLNWSVVDAGAFDYAADAWGYTWGAAAEWTKADWTLRGGVFQMSEVPNAKVTGLHPRQFMLVGEVESRGQWLGHPGKLKLLGFVNRGRMANYRDAVDLALATGGAPDVVPVRRWQWRPGAALNIEQEVAADAGVFLRASVNDGDREAYEFTEINRSLSTGLALKGTRWGRADDTVGLALAVNALSSAARDYFAAGGMGILIGDGRLDYGAERILETYYAWQLPLRSTLTLDYQHVTNPAHNRDRGPVSIVGLRLHAQF
jgi:high affinity Mn2+ porin